MKRNTPLRSTLRAARVSQRAVAEQLGISEATMSRWVTGETPPAVDDAARLVGVLRARGVHVTMDELFGQVEAA